MKLSNLFYQIFIGLPASIGMIIVIILMAIVVFFIKYRFPITIALAIILGLYLSTNISNNWTL